MRSPRTFSNRIRRLISLTLIVVFSFGSVGAGILITLGNGIAITGADGVTYLSTSGITATGADGLLALGVNGIVAPTTAGITATGADGVTYTGSDGITATGVDSLTITRTAGITATGADGITITGADGSTYHADSVSISQANGITATGVDQLTATGTNGITATGVDSRNIPYADGITATGVDGITITGADGITITGADGQVYSISPNGITITGADGITASVANGITITGADTISYSSANGLTVTGADSLPIRHADGITVTGVDGMTINAADGITASGVNGITITRTDGTIYHASSAFFRRPNGITGTGVDAVTGAGVDGISATGVDTRQIASANGLVLTGPDAATITSVEGIIVTGTDGSISAISPSGLTITGADGITAIGASGIAMTGADNLTATGVEYLQRTGLQSVDPELALMLNQLTDDSNINAAIVYHRLPTDADLADLQGIGILGGTRYHVIPVIFVSGTRDQLISVSHLPAVRAICGNRTLPTLADVGGGMTGTDRARTDADLTGRNGGLPVSGRGVTVAVLDTGLNGTHADLAGRVVNNVKLTGTPGVGVGFNYSTPVENLSNTDQVYGHGTFVAGIIGGSGARSSGKYTGVAPGVRLLGLSAGDLNLFFVLEGYDYLLANGAPLGVRVVNCSFSADTLYDPNDPINVATKLLTERGINVVFSAGNTGPGLHTLNPYAMAPWVISVGATDARGRLASFSSRGDFSNPNARPTIVAPGVSVISLRSSLGLSVTGALGIESGTDLQRLALTELPYYTTSSGTSFTAPQVAGTIALMLEVNPLLTPSEVRNNLQRTATPLPPYYQHEVGAGMLNAHAAVLEAAFPERRMGTFRATLDRGQARFIIDPPTQFSGTVPPYDNYITSLTMPQNALLASVQVAWGPLLGLNDLALRLTSPDGVARPEINTINLPGLTGKRERDVVSLPASGTWSARVRQTTSLVGTPQPFSGALEVTRVEYPTMVDISGLSATELADIYQDLRSFVMSPFARRYRPDFTVSRFDLATALVLGGRVPQYLPVQPRYTDVRDAAMRIMVESAQAAPGGALFPDASPGGQFQPNARATRLAAAIALVRAVGLRSEADAQAGSVLPFLDASSIPSAQRGYVKVALARGLLNVTGMYFYPQNPLARVELSHSMVTIANIWSQ